MQKKFKLHLYAGVGYVTGPNDSDPLNPKRKDTTMFDLGLISSIGRFVFSFGTNQWKRNDGIDFHINYIDFGVGVRF
jgi:hypothetical protein